MRKPTIENKFDLTIEDCKKLIINDRVKITEKPFWRNDVIGAWCLSKNTAKNSGDHIYEYGSYSEFWIGICDDEKMGFGFHFSCYGGMCGYNFSKFFDPKEIENEDDLKVQELFLETINSLLDKRILALPVVSTEWTKTDDFQYVRQINPTTYEVINVFGTDKENKFNICKNTIDLNDYSDESILDHIKPFDYRSVEDVSEKYGKCFGQIIAECISENDPESVEILYLTEDEIDDYIERHYMDKPYISLNEI